jgi:hypothetical protein
LSPSKSSADCIDFAGAKHYCGFQLGGIHQELRNYRQTYTHTDHLTLHPDKILIQETALAIV